MEVACPVRSRTCRPRTCSESLRRSASLGSFDRRSSSRSEGLIGTCATSPWYTQRSMAAFAAILLEAAEGQFGSPILKDRGVRLVESRKGPRVSERHGTSSYSGAGESIGFKGVRVGGGGESSSSTHSVCPTRLRTSSL